MVFFLGGKPTWLLDSSGKSIQPGSANFDPTKPVITGFAGFSANPANPFDNSTSRIAPYYDFDLSSAWWISQPGTAGFGAGFGYWPKVQAVGGSNSEPMVYFRAENGNYTVDGNPLNNIISSTSIAHVNNTNAKSETVFPDLHSIQREVLETHGNGRQLRTPARLP